MHSTSLQQLAYEVLGQRVEKMLGYAFLLWCVAMLFSDSTGKTKAFGVVVLAAIFFIAIYTIVTAYGGGEAPAPAGRHAASWIDSSHVAYVY